MAEGTEWCRSRYGQVAYATRQREDGTFSCDCTGDYELDFSVGRCVGATPETIAAERTAQCEHDNGAGYTAGTVLADGSFHCVPPASVADADCKNLYGSDWYAGSAKGDGSYMCHQKMTKDSARASCISAYGRRFIRVVYQNGEYRCEYSRGGRRRPRPDAGADAEAIGTAIGIGAGILINEMAKRKRSRGQGGGKCHRDPNTGQVHCGGN